ncbi:OLC1v1012338C1, partial [Oldenlandia corymbosa var. corymbosa]
IFEVTPAFHILEIKNQMEIFRISKDENGLRPGLQDGGWVWQGEYKHLDPK